MAYTTAQARELAVSAMLYLLERPDLTQEFLADSGLAADDLRLLARGPELPLQALDFLLQSDSRVLEAARDLGVAPQDMLAARTSLAGPGSYGWQPD